MKNKLTLFFLFILFIFVTQCSIYVISKTRGDVRIETKHDPDITRTPTISPRFGGHNNDTIEVNDTILDIK